MVSVGISCFGAGFALGQRHGFLEVSMWLLIQNPQLSSDSPVRTLEKMEHEPQNGFLLYPPLARYELRVKVHRSTSSGRSASHRAPRAKAPEPSYPAGVAAPGRSARSNTPEMGQERYPVT